MVILRESADLVLKLLSILFMAVLSVVVIYSLWEMYMHEPEIFSVFELIICGALIFLSSACALLRYWLNFDIDDDEGC